MASSSSSKTDKKPGAGEIPLAEWIVSGIGLVLVGGVIGYLGYAAVTHTDSPPDIRVDVVSIVPVQQGYLAQFRATNQGGEAANDVHILGTLAQGPAAETSEATLDFLPARSETSGGLFFSAKPTAENLTLRATGYQEP